MMVLRSEPSGFIEWMRSPLSSRTKSRPERVTPDAFFDLVASSIVMIFPFVSQLRFDAMRHITGTGYFQVQRMTHFLLFRLQIGERMCRRADLAGQPFDDLDARGVKRVRLAGVVGQQANARNAKVVEDYCRQAEIPEVRLEAERVVGLDRV